MIERVRMCEGYEDYVTLGKSLPFFSVELDGDITPIMLEVIFYII